MHSDEKCVLLTFHENFIEVKELNPYREKGVTINGINDGYLHIIYEKGKESFYSDGYIIYYREKPIIRNILAALDSRHSNDGTYLLTNDFVYEETHYDTVENKSHFCRIKTCTFSSFLLDFLKYREEDEVEKQLHIVGKDLDNIKKEINRIYGKSSMDVANYYPNKKIMNLVDALNMLKGKSNVINIYIQNSDN